jgi:hypothetical protein
MTCIVTGGKEELGISIMNDLLPRLLDILGGKKAIRDLIDSRVGAHWLARETAGTLWLEISMDTSLPPPPPTPQWICFTRLI